MALAITGKSGAGKHTAAEFLAHKQWEILDVDKIAHYLYRPYTHVWKAVVDAFGEGILGKNDLINRQKLSQIVFNEADPESAQVQLEKLNAIVHPAIRLYLEEQIHRKFRKGTPIAIVAALHDELGLSELCGKTLLIKADQKQASLRIQRRDGISPEIYALRVKKQSEPAQPDWVIENNGTIQEFHRKLAALSF